MASVILNPWTDDLDEVATLSSIAKILIDVRILCCLLAVGWVLAVGQYGGVLAFVAGFAGWLVFVLVRWDQIGPTLLAHPAIHALDLAAWLLVSWSTDPTSPLVLCLALGAILLGVCLDWWGALFFGPLLVVGWLLVVRADDRQLDYTGMVVIPVALGACLGFGALVRRTVIATDHMERERRQQVRVAGISEERARLARELHDSLVKTLHGVALLADTIPLWLQRDPRKAALKAEQVGGLLREALADSRGMLVSMRRTEAGADLDRAVVMAVRRWQDTTGRKVETRLSGGLDLPAETTLEMVAILNEALANVAKHTAPEVAVRVAAHRADAWVEMVVSDDGPGLGAVDQALSKPAHYGMRGMQERALRVGGRVALATGTSGGLEVRVRVPAGFVDLRVIEGAGLEGAGLEEVGEAGGRGGR